MDRAEAEAVAHERLSRRLRVADDVRRVEEPQLLQPADRAAVAVGREHAAAEVRLVDALLHLADDVAALDRVLDVDGLALVVGPAHAPEREQDAQLVREVLLDVRRIDGVVAVGPGADEVDDGHAEEVGLPEQAVEVVVRVGPLVGVEDAFGGLLVPVAALLRRAHERERRRAPLDAGRAVDAVGAVQERDLPATEAEALRELRVPEVGAPLRLQHVERGEADGAEVVVAFGAHERPSPRSSASAAAKAPCASGPKRTNVTRSTRSSRSSVSAVAESAMRAARPSG